MTRRAPVPPKNLSPRARALWRYVCRGWDLEEHHLQTLRAACEALSRMDQARVLLAREGVVYRDRFNAPRRHPAISIEENSRTAYLRAMRELNLDDETLTAVRPPRGRGRRS